MARIKLDILSPSDTARNERIQAKLLNLFSNRQSMSMRELLRHFHQGDRRSINWALSGLLGAQLNTIGRGVKGDPQQVVRGAKYPQALLAPIPVTNSVL